MAFCAWRWAFAQNGHSHLRPTYAPLTPERQLPARIVRGPLKAILVQLGRVWAFKLVVVLMAYATTYAQLTPAYASLRHMMLNK